AASPVPTMLLTWAGSGDLGALRGRGVVRPHFLAVFIAAGLMRPVRGCKLVASPDLRGLSHDRRSDSRRSGPRSPVRARRPRGTARSGRGRTVYPGTSQRMTVEAGKEDAARKDPLSLRAASRMALLEFLSLSIAIGS